MHHHVLSWCCCCRCCCCYELPKNERTHYKFMYGNRNILTKNGVLKSGVCKCMCVFVFFQKLRRSIGLTALSLWPKCAKYFDFVQQFGCRCHSLKNNDHLYPSLSSIYASIECPSNWNTRTPFRSTDANSIDKMYNIVSGLPWCVADNPRKMCSSIMFDVMLVHDHGRNGQR